MPTCLVIADRTLGGTPLTTELGRRLKIDGITFHVLVPAAVPEGLVLAWSPDGMVPLPASNDLARSLAHARRRNEKHLGDLIARIEQLGGQASGEVGDPDLRTAAYEVLERLPVDHVLLAVPRRRLPRWLAKDLGGSLARDLRLAVTVVESSERL